MGCVLFVGKILYKRGNIHAGNTAPVLRPEFDCRLVGNHQLPAVPPDMVVHAVLQCLQNSGFSVIAAAHKKGDASGNTHTGHRPHIGKLHCHLKGIRGLERHCSLHGLFGYAAFPWKYGAVRNKSAKAKPVQTLPDILLVLAKADCLL